MNPIQTVVSAYLLVSRRNDALSRSGRRLFFGSIVVVLLVLRSQGREVAFGELLSHDQRLAVASELRRFMKSY